MKSNAIHARLARMRRECECVVGPVLLLFVACAALVLVLGLNAVLDEAPAEQAAQPAQHTTPPAT